ncbi:putative activating signal cointegrator 1 complex subunit 3 [Apostichopus japonicus]|uniref:Putative activating signal cointegrator 1 complex subunit 3 n=1 Tax=Stichopus japonicus TaxID=307972 RepID=A0A2G8L8R2_STIJA|nr:putative activating signal cointegrator 1 complex subunit 3 [Apostichopus japonicus]
MHEAEVFSMVSLAEEFEQIKVREDEMVELDRHHMDDCAVQATGGTENTQGKVNILLQSFISRSFIDSFSLVSDSAYVAQFPHLGEEILRKLDESRHTVDRLRDMPAKEIGHLIRHVRKGELVKQAVDQLPAIELEATLQPITRTVMKVSLTITPDFKWNDRVHGNVSESWWIWVEDPENNHIYHSEYFILQKKQVINQEPQSLVFTIPLFEPLPSQYYVKAVSERWLGSETVHPLSFQHLILPERHPPHTELLDLTPLPITALQNINYERLYKYTHFNPVQTQIFHTLYHTNYNVLLGAPTGSGKTVAAEIAMFRVFNEQPKSKIVYIAPLKALVRERITDWKVRLEQSLNKVVVELTGDVAPDIRAIAKADVIVTTQRSDDRGPVLEVIVSRTNFISSHTSKRVRVIGLSTALANAQDLADWLGIKQVRIGTLFPCFIKIQIWNCWTIQLSTSGTSSTVGRSHLGVSRQTLLSTYGHNEQTDIPSYQGSFTVQTSFNICVVEKTDKIDSSGSNCFLAAENDPKMWLHMDETEMDHIIDTVRETNLKLTLAFGIGIHHAGLHERDRRTTEELFVNQKIQVLIATSTLAWGVNFPAHLVVVKGTEFYDGKTKRYVDFPITDVLQMMGRAGRPQFDDQGTAVILVHDIKKHFYKKFLYEPFPVESNLLDVLAEHLNAEIVAGTINSKQDALDYITWTYFFRRLVMNPSYYSLEDTEHNSVNTFLSQLVEKSVVDLGYAYCLEIGEDNRTLMTTTLGRIASYYYLHHQTVKMFRDSMGSDCSISDLLHVLSDAHEYEDLPVRHNEDSTNSTLASKLPLPVNEHTYDNPHTKTHLLLQAHFSREQLPMSDYLTDTKSVLDQAIRVLQAMIDVAADEGWLITALRVMTLIQMVLQGRWSHHCPLLILPHIEKHLLHCFRNPERKGKTLIDNLPELIAVCNCKKHLLTKMLKPELTDHQVDEIWEVLQKLPVIDVRLGIKGWWAKGNQEEKRRLEGIIKDYAKDDQYITVHADQEYVLEIEITRISKSRHKNDQKAFSPRFTKAKTEGWFMVLGDIENRELMALKRVGFVQSRSTVQLSFYTPENPGRYIYNLYIMSDSYLGLDQQYSVCLKVIEADIEAQLNSEIADDS